MIVEIEIEDWQFDCCGEPFGIGSEVTWDIHAAVPAMGSDEVPRLYEDHHNSVDDGVPEVEITGTVREIYATADRVVAVPGERWSTNDHADSLEEKIDSAERFHEPPDGYTHTGFRVRLEIPDGTELPAYVETKWTAKHRIEQQKLAAKVAKLRSSKVGLRLLALAESVEKEFGERVSVESLPTSTGVTIRPANPHACAIRWVYSGKILRVEVGEGEWEFVPARAGVERLEVFVEAAAAGRVAERITAHHIATVVTDAHGGIHTTRVAYEPPTGSGYFIGTRESERYQRGDVDYEPW